MEPTPNDILPAAEYAAAQWDGAWIWIERLVVATVTARQKLGAHVYHLIAGVHLKGLLVTTADPDGEADCRWLGLVERWSVPNGPPTARKLWYADEQTVAPSSMSA